MPADPELLEVLGGPFHGQHWERTEMDRPVPVVFCCGQASRDVAAHEGPAEPEGLEHRPMRGNYTVSDLVDTGRDRRLVFLWEGWA